MLAYRQIIPQLLLVFIWLQCARSSREAQETHRSLDLDLRNDVKASDYERSLAPEIRPQILSESTVHPCSHCGSSASALEVSSQKFIHRKASTARGRRIHRRMMQKAKKTAKDRQAK